MPQNLSQPLAILVRPLSLGMHEIEVELTLPAGAAADGAVAALPAWTPGSYLVRDYARFLDRVKVTDAAGRPHPFEKIDKQRWRVAPSPGELRFTYRLFCNDLTVRTNHVDATHAHLVGAASFLYLEGQQARPFRVAFAGWPGDWRVATSLPLQDGTYLAADHDTLVDSPFELGTFRLHEFRVRECDFQLAVTGRHAGNEARIVEATAAVVEACARIFGGFPFPRYLFLLTFSPKIRGGLEHRDSTSLLADPQQLEKAEGYWDLFTLIAHEFFHVWNVKRMRDTVLGPFDYLRENSTRLLWFHEGFTSFMQYAIVLKAGVAPWTWVARRLGHSWTDNTTRPGRLEQGLEHASFDAWIRHYKPTEFGTNSTVSYYDKGSLVAWMLDAQLRLASAGERGLGDFFRDLWERHGDGPVTDGDLRRAYQERTGRDPDTFWGPYIQGTTELDATDIEKAYGLKLAAWAPWELLGGADAEDPDAQRRARVYSGLTFQAGAPAVANVLPASPAAKAGLGYGMEILAVDGWRTASAQEAQNRIGDAGPGDTVRILAADRGVVADYDVTLGENPLRTTLVTADAKATQAQKAAFQAWTGLAFPGKAPMNPLDWDLGNLPPGIPWGGVDEAGRGAWAGPVVAACAVLNHEAASRWGHVLREARDSKLVPPEKRKALAAELKQVLPSWAVAEVDSMAIDRENILEASLLAMRQAMDQCQVRPRILLVDGNRAPRSGVPERLVVDGDALSCAIACASILAKAHRDALMEEMDERIPGYGFKAHKGYGTPAHRKALAELGPSMIHRISYAPVAALQRPEETRRERLAESLEACASVAALQAWVDLELRPAYGNLRLAWVETLRGRYAERLAYLAGKDLS